MDYSDKIREMLNSNLTPEKIYQTALDELQKLQKEKESTERLEKEREELIRAIVYYLPDAFPSIDFGDLTSLAQTVENVLKQAEKDGPDLVRLYIKLNDVDAKYGSAVDAKRPTADEKVKNVEDVFNAFFKKHGLF